MRPTSTSVTAIGSSEADINGVHHLQFPQEISRGAARVILARKDKWTIRQSLYIQFGWVPLKFED
jgi:hypothetical protein